MRDGVYSLCRQMHPPYCVLRKFLGVTLLFCIQLIVAGGLAMCQPPGGGGGGIPTIMGNPGVQPPTYCTAGATYPWYDRAGKIKNMISGGYSANLNGHHVPGVTAKFCGQDCKMIEMPTETQYFYYGTPISPTVGIWHWTIEFFYNGTAIPKIPNNGKIEGSAYVYKVESKEPSNSDDDVVTASSLVLNGITLEGPASLTHADTRTVKTGFKVTAPVEAGNFFGGVTVGIIQTVTTGSVLGSMSYHSGSVVGYANFALNGAQLPLIDALATTSPFISGTAFFVDDGFDGVHTQLGSGAYTWETNDNSYLHETDNPAQVMIDLPDATNQNFSWGRLDQPIFYTRARGGSPSTLQLETGLYATAYSSPDVYVLIKSFKSWTVTFDGGLGVLDPYTWSGGSVQSFGGTAGKPAPKTPTFNAVIGLTHVFH